MGIRNAARALIVENNKILVNKNQSSMGDCCPYRPNGMIYYDLPGGGQNQYETAVGDIPLFPELVKSNIDLILTSTHTVYLGSQRL